MALHPVLAMMLGYIGVVVLAFFVINFLMAGFFLVFMKVKGSRGKKILTNIYAVNRNYAKPGFVDNGFYIYEDGNKHEKRLKIPKNANVFYRFLNVTWCNVDEEKNVFITPDGKEINGFDAEKYNNLYLRTLYRPAVFDPKQQLQFILQIIDTIATVIILLVVAFIILKKLDLILNHVIALETKFSAITLNNTIA